MRYAHAISICVSAGIPPLLVGRPGIGKSATCKALADALGLPLIDLRGNQLDRADLAVPIIRDDGPELFPYPLLRRAVEEPVVLLLDELLTAPEAVQSAFLGLCLDRRVQDIELHPETVVILATNDAEDSPGGTDLAPPLADRLCIILFEPDYEVWRRDMLDEPIPVPVLPRYTAEERRRWARVIAEFHDATDREWWEKRVKEELAPGIPKPVANPRGWKFVSKLLAAAPGVTQALLEKGSATTDAELGLRIAVEGVVGPEAVAAFLSWARKVVQIRPEEALEAARKGDWQRIDQLSSYALATVMAKLAERKDWATEDAKAVVKLVCYLMQGEHRETAYAKCRDITEAVMRCGEEVLAPICEVYTAVMDFADGVDTEEDLQRRIQKAWSMCREW